MKKRICILGSTGSVGKSALKVVAAMPDSFDVVLLVAHRAKEALLQQAQAFQVPYLAISSPEDAQWLREQLPKTTVVAGADDLIKLIADLQLDFTLSAIVGAAGLKPTMAAIHSGSAIGLANKESMVIAGTFMNHAARKHQVEIIPIDSEHNALHQCLRGEKRAEVKRLILTASGGPFRTYEGSFDEITPEQALKHPTWDMGPKISIDSATMMNKGLEVMEAHHLFDFSGEEIDIVVHPQSIVHSMIETIDASYKCQLGKTDMCDPIQYALTWPDRKTACFEGLDITKGAILEFFEVDRQRFPCIQLAYDALAMGDSAPAVLNAANEITVQAFLDKRIRFTQIAQINGKCMALAGHRKLGSLDDVLDIDREARRLTEELISKSS